MNKLVLTSNDPNVVTSVQLFAQSQGLELEVSGGNVLTLPTPKPLATLASLEATAIQEAISACKGNLSEAAKSLQIGRATLYRKVKEYNLSTKEFRKTAA